MAAAGTLDALFLLGADEMLGAVPATSRSSPIAAKRFQQVQSLSRPPLFRRRRRRHNR
jgi:hypothetical protein